MVQENQPAPDFSLPSANGGEVSLASLKGKRVVLYFYPKDMTPGCTTEAQEFRDAVKALEKHNAVVLGMSKDSIESHCKFRDKYDLNFHLLSDPDGRVLEAYGAWGEKNMYGKKTVGVIRTTVVIGEDSSILKLYRNVRVKGHVEKVVTFLQGL